MQIGSNTLKPLNTLIKLASITCLSIASYGCSTQTKVDNTTQEQPLTPEQQQQYMMEKVESWSAAEPDIQRILALESDMQLIVEQLAVMAELDSTPLNTSPAGAPNNKSAATMNNQGQSSSAIVYPYGNENVASPYANQTAAQADSSANGTQTPSDANNKNAPSYISNNCKSAKRTMGHCFPKVGLHVAMFKDINSIPVGWQYLQSVLPQQLTTKRPLISQLTFEGIPYYSLRIGPFKTSNSAKNTCNYLQQQQHYCSVVEYKGMTFN